MVYFTPLASDIPGRHGGGGNQLITQSPQEKLLTFNNLSHLHTHVQSPQVYNNLSHTHTHTHCHMILVYTEKHI